MSSPDATRTDGPGKTPALGTDSDAKLPPLGCTIRVVSASPPTLPCALQDLSAAQLHQAYACRQLSPVEVARAVIDHVKSWEPHLHATWDFDPGPVMAMAQDSESRWLKGEQRGLLDGVPVTIKENVATQGQAVPLGTAASQLTPAGADAPPAARLREAGAVFVAKTTMPDYGMLSSGLSSFHALARNPWNLQNNPGGSSAGAGAAAAAGYGPLHLGTDIGGSIRLPASWCGVVGLKPSHGRVPIYPPFIGRVAGPMARSVSDVAWMMETLSRPDWRDATSLPFASLPWTDLEGAEPQPMLKGKKIGLWLDAGWGMPVQADVRAAVMGAAQVLEAAGAQIQEVPAFTDAGVAEGINRFWRLRSWLEISALPPERQERVLPFIRAWVAEAAQYSTAQAFHGFNQMGVLRDAASTACQPFDYVISPVAPLSAFAATWAMPSNDPGNAMAHIAFTLPFNMSGQPAISVPCAGPALTNPVGLQIIGRCHDDIGVLRVARAFEQLRGQLPPWPQPPA